MSDKSFGQIIREARQKNALSQKELAAQIKKENGESISAQYQNDIEFDRRDPPSENMIEQFAAILNLHKDYLIFAAGRLPSDLQRIAAKSPKAAEEIARAFRKKNESEK